MTKAILLMTGCYAERIGMGGQVVFPAGLSTLADCRKQLVKASVHPALRIQMR